jgi:hypothetical protein
LFLLRSPSNDRDWSPDQAVLPWAESSGDHVTIHNVRRCTYRSKTDFDVALDDRTFDLARIRTVDFVIEPFAVWRGPAHTFLSFGFEGGQYIAISVEIRKQRGQHFSALLGMFRTYEIMYVIADERDLLELRVIHRQDDVYVYPLRATPDGARQLFLDMLETANSLRHHPQFYNTLTNNCATSIWRHVNHIVRPRVPFSFSLFLPGYSDRLVHQLGWIDTELSFAEARRRFRINERVRKYADDPGFSIRIREVTTEHTKFTKEEKRIGE